LTDGPDNPTEAASNDHESEPAVDRWRGGTPVTVQEVYCFYNNYVKKLYAYIQASNELPQETLFELNAAFDHLTRIAVLGEPEEEACKKAYSHLKRSCLDIFKLRVNQVAVQYKQLLRIDLSVVNNGSFSGDLNRLRHQIKTDATQARHQEGLTDRDDAIPAFKLWEDVFLLCDRFENEFFLNPNVNWAETRQAANRARNLVTGAAIVLLVQAVIRLVDGQPGIGLGFGLVAVTTITAAVFWGIIGHHWIYATGRAAWRLYKRQTDRIADAAHLRAERTDRATSKVLKPNAPETSGNSDKTAAPPEP